MINLIELHLAWVNPYKQKNGNWKKIEEKSAFKQKET